MQKIAKIFAGIGLFFLCTTLFLWVNDQKKLKPWIKVEGTIIDLVGQDTYAPVFEFKAKNGDIFNVKSNTSSNPPSFEINEKVEVIYDPQNPNKAKINTFFQLYLIEFILGIIAIIFTCIGFGMLFFQKRKEAKINYLKMFGQRIETEFKKVDLNYMIAINQKHPYRILTEGFWNGEKRLFLSENLWFDPIPYLQVKQKIIILIDLKNSKNYYMDISFLPKNN